MFHGAVDLGKEVAACCVATASWGFSVTERREICPECGREVANEFDEGVHNTGECGCPKSRALCWRVWNGDRCLPRSIYDTLNP